MGCGVISDFAWGGGIGQAPQLPPKIYIAPKARNMLPCSAP